MNATNRMILLSVLSVLFIFASNVITPQPSETMESSEADTKSSLELTSLGVGEVQGFTLRKADSALGVIPHGTDFEIIGDEMPYDRERLAAFLYASCHLTAERLLDTPDPPTDYGLDPPVTQISLLQAGNTPLRIRIGDLCPVSAQRYAMVEGSEQIALLSEEVSELLASSPEDLQDLRFFPNFDADSKIRLERITLSSRSESFTLQRISDSVSGLFEMISPVQSTVDWRATNDHLLVPLAALEPTRFISDVPDAITTYNLNDPDISLTLSFAGRTVHCLFRLDQSADICYCYSPEQGRVCSMPGSAVSFLTSLSYTDLLGGTIYRQAISQVSRVSLNDTGRIISVFFSGSGENLTAHTNHILLNANEASRFYSQVTAIPIAGTLTDQAIPEATPLLTLTVSLKDGQAHILEFLPLTPQYCAVSINGVCQFATFSSVVQLLRQAFDTVE